MIEFLFSPLGWLILGLLFLYIIGGLASVVLLRILAIIDSTKFQPVVYSRKEYFIGFLGSWFTLWVLITKE